MTDLRADRADNTTLPSTRLTLDLQGQDYYDRVYGCWQGKNAGGTLGTPLEKAFGEDEPFDVWWYPELAEGGLPNDDLEMQLAWLKAAEEVGPGLTARDMTGYWLDHIGYNFDEYGLSKGNLRLGLEPPISGSHNNWFVDCMGSPIRSEIWACIAPGAPRVAARLAIQDAICDHAGGEGVNGEVFNAAVESSAFVVQDPVTLINIGLSYIPADSASARAVRAVLDAHRAGLDWKAAREAVRQATPHYVAQYSPINLGFQVIGLLYGTDFGDGMCKTVNCGYDTDSSGAAIGSYLGILHGSSRLPARWVEPLGDTIATNESWGGVKHLSDGLRPVPQTLDELVARIRLVADRVLRHHGLLNPAGLLELTEPDLFADPDFAAELASSNSVVTVTGPMVSVTIDYHGSPVVRSDEPRTVTTELTNRREEALEITAELALPTGWPPVAPQQVTLQPGAAFKVNWRLPAVPRALINNSNRLRLDLSVEGRPAPAPIPFVLVGAVAQRVSGPYLLDGPVDAALAGELPPERVADGGRLGGWVQRSVEGNDAEVGDLLKEPGVLYIQTYLESPDDRSVRLGVDASVANRVWLNNTPIATVESGRPVRPSLNASSGPMRSVNLRRGWNELLIKLVRDHDHSGPVDCFVLMAGDDRLRAVQYDVGRSRLPGDAVSTEL
ncbi:ADP-ribosylglycohydrolase family protein [Microlunatus elymi]|uniref:ADP-ribosylglycohydrolase family protein n=1 Tax=Microlunatus elymi TaxID=2596828 RepID=A0A516PW22_9ACTN|nr:ADP-ribosylglycohydrolase family protein [Microlunatus elymi]QDP95375.1 ADP-ribosylglycohydrolase family protein [Microlunatus elymi]